MAREVLCRRHDRDLPCESCDRKRIPGRSTLDVPARNLLRILCVAAALACEPPAAALPIRSKWNREVHRGPV